MEKEIIISEDFEKNSSMGCIWSFYSLFLVGSLIFLMRLDAGESRVEQLGQILVMIFILAIITATIVTASEHFKSAYKPENVLIISDEGITDKKVDGFIPWSEVRDVNFIRNKEKIQDTEKRIIVLNVKNNEKILERLSPKERKKAVTRIQKGGFLVRISASGLTPSPQELYKIIRERFDWYEDQQGNKK